MEKETENLSVEEEDQDALVDYDSDSSIITVIERERDSEETVRNLEKEKVKLRRLELEAETKNENREKLEKPEVRVQRAAAEENMKQVKCYRCNRMGHMAKDCPLIESGAWFCYNCQEVRGHKGDSCPNAGAQANKFRGKRYTNKTVNKNVKIELLNARI
ncbi:DNA-binding protein HEXBP-like [Temnothorax curvispinosus]|uniref:DNA-binding protein HEXBP-like n=1 Tax=Temnothorax curvispinosus TaxID=300111 RepID=A0A6J1QZS5_9HYME|nr:DNA-binding protein HEXBP-like [Temnothorax curvispinosus]